MYPTDKITNAFLEIDFADCVFELLFVFLQDDGSAVQNEQTFESAMHDIIVGVHIPKEALERVRVIYDRTTESCPVLYDSATRVKAQLSQERPMLLMLFSVLLRLAMDEGMMCRRDRERLTEVFRIFSFSPEELDSAPDELQKRIECFIRASGFYKDTTLMPSLFQHFETLECSPESSSDELRTSYRRLVKKYHPDRQNCSNPESREQRQKFQEVQTAYEAITQAKKLS